jgi:hypothetical protein
MRKKKTRGYDHEPRNIQISISVAATSRTEFDSAVRNIVFDVWAPTEFFNFLLKIFCFISFFRRLLLDNNA